MDTPVKVIDEQSIDSIVISALPSGKLDDFVKYRQILSSKPVIEARLTEQQVEKSLRRLAKTRDERIVFYKDSTFAYYPDSFSSYRYKKAVAGQRQ